jgi:hypothetical protein
MSQKFRDIKTKMIVLKNQTICPWFSGTLWTKEEKTKGWIIRPCRDATSWGRIVQGMQRPRDASSKGCIIQGMLRPGMLRPGTHSSGTHRHGTQNSVVLTPIGVSDSNQSSYDWRPGFQVPDNERPEYTAVITRFQIGIRRGARSFQMRSSFMKRS